MQKFTINVQQSAIDDLKARIADTRWIRESEHASWSSELGIGQIQEIADYWADTYDWKARENYLNGFAQYRAEIEGLDIHFVCEKGSGAQHIPILLLHGWAGNFTEYLKILEIARKESPDCDIIIPSLPGFAFSEAPQATLSANRVAAIINQLMVDVLGYDSYYVHGGDFGSIVGEKLALNHARHVRGLHISDIPVYHLYSYNDTLSPRETEYMEGISAWSMQDGAYAMVQSTRPKTLSMGLNNSPIGLAVWLLQLYHDFSDRSAGLTARYSLDDLLGNISLYWFTESIYSSMRIYAEDNSGFEDGTPGKAGVPTGFCFYPHNIGGVPPREFAERFFANIVDWNTLASGGHFAALEQPALVHAALLDFITKVESSAGR